MSQQTISLDHILRTAEQTLSLDEVDSWLAADDAAGVLAIKRAAGSSLSFAIRRVIESTQGPVVVIAPEADRASQVFSDLNTLGITTAREFRPSTHHPYDTEQIVDSSAFTDRLDILAQIDGGAVFPVITSPDALFELVPDRSSVEDRSIVVTPAGPVTMDVLTEWLGDTDFNRVDYVTEAGEAAVRGGIIDVFPFTGEYPIRIEFFGDEVDTIREFDVDTQRSISTLDTCRLVPGIDLLYHDMSSHRSFLDSLSSESAVVVMVDEDVTIANTTALFESSVEAYRH
ncbi:MAG: hypothetical protein HKN43_02240, partial [Rhodothermales bacterium]|nr:hypothetical protein [Rhodothermales bacterium]